MELDTNQNIDTAKAYLEGMLGVVYGNNYEIFQNNDSKHKKSIKNQLFVIGRNLLQAAVGGSRSAANVIADSDVLVEYSLGGDNHLLNGILFEIYFNHDGQFRYKNFKIGLLNELMQHARIEPLKCSFAFIHEILKGFAQFLIFIPSPEPARVAINVKLKKEMVEPVWSDPEEASVVKTIFFEGNELLADEGDSNVFPFNREQDIREETLANLLCEGYGIPSAFLDIIYNEKPEKHWMWLDRKFRRNFRGSGKEDELDIMGAEVKE